MKRHSTKPGGPATSEAPIRLPLVQMNVHPDGAMAVLVDGEVFAPPPHAPAWRRESFSAVIDTITARLNTPVKVHVVEYDGATFTDVVVPRRTAALPPAGPQAPSSRVDAPAAPVSVSGHGFLAGEEVAIAPIIGFGSTAPDGQVRAVVAQDQVPPGVQEMVLVGRVSGTMQIVRALP